MRYRHDPEGTRLPIKLDATTNGEFAPVPLAPVHREANERARAAAAEQQVERCEVEDGGGAFGGGVRAEVENAKALLSPAGLDWRAEERAIQTVDGMTVPGRKAFPS